MEYKCKENDCLIEMGKDKSEILISIQGETVKTVIGLKDLSQALILFGVSNQRELLIAFTKWVTTDTYVTDEEVENDVDMYISNL